MWNTKEKKKVFLLDWIHFFFFFQKNETHVVKYNWKTGFNMFVTEATKQKGNNKIQFQYQVSCPKAVQILKKSFTLLET